MTEATAADAPMNYRAAVSASPEQALTLGVVGHDADANRRRVDVAARILEEWSVVSEAAYSQAGTLEPYVPVPFCLNILVATGGDVRSALNHEDFAGEVLESLGLSAHEDFIRDEDGERWVWIAQPADAWPQVDQEVQRLRDVLGLPATPQS